MLAIKKVNAPPAPGSYEPDVIYLVPDGANNVTLYASDSSGVTVKRGLLLSDISSAVSSLYSDLTSDIADAKAEIIAGASTAADTLEKLELLLTGKLSKATGGTISGPVVFESAQRVGLVELGAGTTIDCSLGTYFKKTVNGTVVFSFSNLPAGTQAYGFNLLVALTSGSFSFPSSVKFPNDTALSLSTGKFHLFTLITDNGGTSWRASVNSNYAA